MIEGIDIRDLIDAKAWGEVLSPEQIGRFVSGAANGSASDEQLAALLMAIRLRGMTTDERAQYTKAMMMSGDVLSWPSIDRPTVDKHSTGGVGDKVSLIWGPLMVAAGFAVPMISGRGLGHTGGTLDKLEAIPGYRTDLSPSEMEAALSSCGIFISGQTETLVPADRRLYDLRSRTATVRSLDHIVASILSKKLAEGTEYLILDVKTGCAAFLPDVDQTRALAQALVDLGAAMGRTVRALMTNMNQPLGRTAGNGLEVVESIECLKGKGPADLRALVVALGVEALVAAGKMTDDDGGRGSAQRELEQLLDDGHALAAFVAMVEQQGGDATVVDEQASLLEIRPVASVPGAALASKTIVTASDEGRIGNIDALGIGRAALAVGAGRGPGGQAPIAGVGIRWFVEIGEEVAVGQPLAEVLHGESGVQEAVREVEAAIEIVDDVVAQPKLVLERIAPAITASAAE